MPFSAPEICHCIWYNVLPVYGYNVLPMYGYNVLPMYVLLMYGYNVHLSVTRMCTTIMGVNVYIHMSIQLL